MTPGFVAKATGSNFFKAEINNTGICQNGTNALVINTYFSNCTSSALDRKANITRPGNDLSESNKDEDLIKMYLAPNPNNGNFKLLFNQKMKGGSIKILNTLGQQVYTASFQNGESIYDLNLGENLIKGTYYILWNSDNYIKTTKFVIQ
jgi:hypothetical protein